MDIKLSKNNKLYIHNTDDVYDIMQRILRRENNIDREKGHLWIIGMNEVGYILYIELMALGTVRSVAVDLMNVFRVAVMKNATRVITVHNHLLDRLLPSEVDKDITDRLIQVGRILNIQLIDHLIITIENYVAFKGLGLMEELEKNLKYLPTYQVIELIRKEEKKIARAKLALEKDKTKVARERLEKRQLTMVTTLLDKSVSIENIAKII